MIKAIPVRKPLLMSCAAVLIACCATGCLRRPPTPLAVKAERRAPTDCVWHRVQRQGETLGVIAKRYTGSSDNWPAIASANPHVDPKRVALRTELCVPRALVKERSYRRRSRKEPAVESPTASQAAPPDEPHRKTREELLREMLEESLR